MTWTLTDTQIDAPGRTGFVAAVSSPVRYGGFYPWYILLASLDIILTWVVLTMGGHEMNGVAQWALGLGGLNGIIALKFATVTVVVVICETIGLRNQRAGRRMAQWSVALSAVPIVVAIVEITATVMIWLSHPNVVF